MRAGTLRHRISIQAPAETQDSTGALITTWLELVETWAEVLPATGSERWIQNMDERVAERSAQIRLRYRDDVPITEQCRIVWNRHTYNIRSISNRFGRNRELVLLCDEVNPDVA